MKEKEKARSLPNKLPEDTIHNKKENQKLIREENSIRNTRRPVAQIIKDETKSKM